MLVLFCMSASSSGLVSHSDLDDRAIEALKEFNEEGALQVLLQFKDSDLSHVQVSVHTRMIYSSQMSSIMAFLAVMKRIIEV